jgi:putative transposase
MGKTVVKQSRQYVSPAQHVQARAGAQNPPVSAARLVINRPNQVWAMDITYIPIARGFVHKAAVLDWFSRRVLAWRLSITLEAEFCLDAV